MNLVLWCTMVLPTSFIQLLVLSAALVYAQPSPEVQQKISAAIAAAANESNPDYTSFVNVFIGTGKIFDFDS